MTDNYRHRLFSSYNATHASYLDPDDDSKLDWFLDYARNNYLPHINRLDRNSTQVLEIACNKGYLLAAFHTLGFKHLHGIDLSPDDVETAKSLLPNATITCIEALNYLDSNKSRFNLIVLKALLEHVQKDQVLTLLEKIRAGLAPEGTVMIEVPNMDWLFAQHERYMDFTHEVGFTREALAQVMRNVFDDVAIVRGRSAGGQSTKRKLGDLVRPALVAFMNIGFRILGEGASDTWWDSRSIIGIAKKGK
ncbi:MAG: class I SAM-dependent methyltransferase [Acidobacteriota bacterium]|nr:class I SAM-dependent methyltransferase [Acidobacteriota bacterium]